MRDESRCDRIEQGVEAGPEEVAIVEDADRPESLAEDGTLQAVTCVEPRSVAPEDPAHPIGEIRVRRLDDCMMVSVEQRRGVDRPPTIGGDAEET